MHKNKDVVRYVIGTAIRIIKARDKGIVKYNKGSSMIILNEETRIYIYSKPIDMRKAIDGLSVFIVESLSMPPQSGDVYLFRNKKGDKIKCLYWDKNGFVLHYKRLEKNRFKFPKHFETTCITITHEQLSWLLAGLDFILMHQFPEINFSNYF